MRLSEIEMELRKHAKRWNSKGKDHVKAASYITQAALSLRYAIQSIKQNADEELEVDL